MWTTQGSGRCRSSKTTEMRRVLIAIEAMAMSEEEMKEHIAEHMDSDLQFVLADSGVTLEAQVSVAKRYNSLRKFRAIGDTRAEVRTACFRDFAIPQDTPDAQAHTAAVVSAWEVAQEYINKEIEIRAEAGQLRQLQTHERQAMIKAVEAVYGVLSEGETPSSDYLSFEGRGD